MVPLWFTLSALCFVGAAVLLYVDIDRRRGLGRRRKSWAKSHGFDYEHESADIVKRWKRGVMSTVGDVAAKNVVLGQIRGEAVFIFDLEDVATVIALHRKVGTNVVVDVRLKGHQGAAGKRHLAARRDRPADGVLHQPRRRAARVRPADGHLRPYRARLRRDHVERAELDARQHADRQHPRPVGRGPAHRPPVQRPAAGAAADPAAAGRTAWQARSATGRRWRPPGRPLATRARLHVPAAAATSLPAAGRSAGTRSSARAAVRNGRQSPHHRGELVGSHATTSAE